MNGLKIKNILLVNNYKLKDIAERMGESPQNLNSMLLSQDVKTGVLERIAQAINVPVYWFYEMDNKDNSLPEKIVTIEMGSSEDDGSGIVVQESNSTKFFIGIIETLTTTNMELTMANKELTNTNTRLVQQIMNMQKTLEEMEEEMEKFRSEYQRGLASTDSADAKAV